MRPKFPPSQFRMKNYSLNLAQNLKSWKENLSKLRLNFFSPVNMIKEVPFCRFIQGLEGKTPRIGQRFFYGCSGVLRRRKDGKPKQFTSIGANIRDLPVGE